LRDFVGRTFILDGSSFDTEESQASLFEPAEKKLDGSYGAIFSERRNQIVSELASESPGSRTGLSKYIANVLYTEPHGAALLSRKGISFDDSELAALKRPLLKLTVNKDICRKYRYWDPFHLQKLNDALPRLDLPSGPFDRDLTSRLSRLLEWFSIVMPEQFEKFVGKQNRSPRRIWVLALYAAQWAREISLPEILDNEYIGDSSDRTEDTISILQNTISYSIPALLGPLYALAHTGNFLLGALEKGAYRPFTVAQINNNVPRETAIRLTEQAEIHGADGDSVESIRIALNSSQLGFWDRVQYKHLFPI
jgi:hypothetical protein